MARDRDHYQLDRLVDALEASVLEANDEDILATGDGAGTAAVIKRALRARNYQSDGSRSVTPRERLRRTLGISHGRARNNYDVTNVSARFSSGGDESHLENDGEDPDVG
jgi:hypothetical protein